MKKYNRICPCCGHVNRNLYLEETDGLMECEQCRKISRGYSVPEDIYGESCYSNRNWIVTLPEAARAYIAAGSTT